MKVVLFDAMNLVHRSRNSFHKGDHPLTYQFFRSFKPLLEKLQPDLAYFVLEGRPFGIRGKLIVMLTQIAFAVLLLSYFGTKFFIEVLAI